MLRNADFGRLRLAFLFAILAYNYTEAAFKGLHFMWWILLVISVDYVDERSRGRAALVSGNRGARESHVNRSAPCPQGQAQTTIATSRRWPRAEPAMVETGASGRKAAGNGAEMAMNYVLITPARNEEAFIERTLQSMIAQTRRPVRWVIVDDGSTDGTAAIVERYAASQPWIELVRRPVRMNRDFAGKVHAFNAGMERVKDLQVHLIGNLDADISFGPDLFEFLVEQFRLDPNLGVAGAAYTQDGWDSMTGQFRRGDERTWACQLFRAECFRQIGGYVANPAGGIDWIAVTTRACTGGRHGTFPDTAISPPSPDGNGGTRLVGAMFDYGAKDYFLGGSPIVGGYSAWPTG